MDSFSYIDASKIHRQIVINYQQDSFETVECFLLLIFMAMHLINSLKFLTHRPNKKIKDVMKHLHIARLLSGLSVHEEVLTNGLYYAQTCLLFGANLDETIQFLKKVRFWSILFLVGPVPSY